MVSDISQMVITYTDLDLSQNVPPATAILRNENYIQLTRDIYLDHIFVHFPPGASNLVEITIGIDNNILVEKLALDNSARTFNIQRVIEAGRVIWAELHNYDATYPHKITIRFFVGIL